MGFKLFLLSLAILLPAPSAFAQEHDAGHEDGHDAAHDRDHDGGHEVMRMDTMHVDYDAGNRPEAGVHDGGGGSSTTSGSIASPAAKIVGVITLGPTTYKLTAGVASKANTIVKEYRENMEATNVISLVAVAFYLYNLVSLNPQAPALDAFLKAITTDPDQLVDALTIQTPMAQLQRNVVISKIDVLIASAPTKDEAKFWKALRDLFSHPEHYRGGGLRFEANRVTMKDDAGANLRSIVGASLNNDDVACLKYLVNEMMGFGPSRDLLLQSDFIYDMKFDRLMALTRRDELILNRALMTAGPNTKMLLSTRFVSFANNPGLNRQFWWKMVGYLNDEKWDANDSGWVDPLAAFERDEDLPEASDISYQLPYKLPGPLLWMP